MKPRLDFIDFLRFLGITLIVLAHVYPPFALLQLRSFDVPLMIFVSGLSYGGRQIQPSLKSYYGPRIKRLVIPSYIFLTFYFSLISLFHVKLNYMGVIKSYLFLNNGTVSYMWIIRIFLLIMLITPFLVRMSNQIKLFYLFVISIIILLIQEILCLFSMDNLFLNEIYQSVVPYLTGYSLIFMFGVKLRNATLQEEKHSLLIFFAMLIALSIGGILLNGFSLELTPKYKYPPRNIFIVYGLFMSSMLWFSRHYFKRCFPMVILFVGRNTMWIYYWHILFLLLLKKVVYFWPVKFLYVYFASIFIVAVQVKIVSYFKKKNIHVLTYFEG